MAWAFKAGTRNNETQNKPAVNRKARRNLKTDVCISREIVYDQNSSIFTKEILINSWGKPLRSCFDERMKERNAHNLSRSIRSMKSRKANPKNAFNAPRVAPDLAPDLSELKDAIQLLSEPESTVQEKIITDLVIGAMRGRVLRIENCVLNRVNFAANSFNSLRLKDVRLFECDLANATVFGLTIMRAEFINCRLTGFQANEADFQHTLISAGDATYSQFRMARFKSANFESCNFSEADFQGSDLRGIVIRNCNLRNAELTGAKLADADLRGSQLEGLRAGADDLKGAIVDPVQAMVLAEIMGLRIR